MLNCTKKIKQLYEEIQRTIFYAIPGKWDELYLYASIIDRLGTVQTGEMYFYFMPKGILKRKFINVYEVPNKYDIDEDEYMKLVKLLYNKIKLLREEFAKENEKVWSNITISPSSFILAVGFFIIFNAFTITLGIACISLTLFTNSTVLSISITFSILVNAF